MIKNILTLFVPILLLFGCSFENDKPPKVEEKIVLQNNLFSAITKGDLESVKHYVENKKADLSSYDESGYTPLMRSIQANNVIMTEYLISKGSKVYQPKRDKPNETAFDEVFESNGGINKLMQEESIRLSSDLEKMLKSSDFNTAILYIDENFLPKNLKIGEENNYLAEYVTKNLDADPSTAGFLNTVLTKYSASEIKTEGFIQTVLDFTSSSKNESLLKTLISKYESEDDSEEKLLVGTFNNSDDQVSWLALKAKLLLDSKIKLNANSLFERYKEQLELSDGFRKNDLKDLDAVQTVLMASSLKTKLTKLMISNVSSSNSGLFLLNDYISKALKVKSYPLSDINDELLKSVYEFDVENNIDLEEIKKFVSLVKKASSKGKDFSPEKSLEYLIKDYQRNSKRKELFTDLALETTKIPDNMISYVIINDRALLSSITKSEEKINFESETDVFKSAIKVSQNPEAARSLMVKLQEIGFNLEGEGLNRAFEGALEKIWDSNSNYADFTERLIEENIEGLSELDSKRKVTLLRKHLSHIRKHKSAWLFTEQFLKLFKKIDDQIRKDGLEPKELLLEKIELDLNGKNTTARSSLLMDVLISMYEIHKMDQSLDSSINNIVKKAARTFINENRSLGSKDEKIDSEKFITHSVLPLSILYSINSEYIVEENLGSNVTDEMKRFLRPGANLNLFVESKSEKLNPINWRKFEASPLYIYFSKNPEYWLEVSKTLEDAGHQIPVLKSRSTEKFFRILLRSNTHEKLNFIRDVMKNNLTKTDEYSNKSCTYKHTTGMSSKVVPIGRLEVLIPFIEKSCFKNEKLSRDDLLVLFDYFSYNFTSDEALEFKEYGGFDEDINADEKAARVSPFLTEYIPLYASNGALMPFPDGEEYTAFSGYNLENFDYISRGLNGLATIGSGSMLLQVGTYKHKIPGKRLFLKGKLKLMKKLNECAAINDDEGLSSYMHTLKDEFPFEHKVLDEIRMCRSERN